MLRKIKFDDISFGIKGPVSLSRDDAVSLVGIRGSTQEKTLSAAWNGHEFEILETYLNEYREVLDEISVRFRQPAGDHNLLTAETDMIVHYPIDPRITVDDVAGAVKAYANADGTAWLFRHCDADYMRDHESLLLSVLTNAFDPMHRQLANRAMIPWPAMNTATRRRWRTCR